MPPESAAAADFNSAQIAESRLQKLRAASPLYTQWLTQYPEWMNWLTKPENLSEFRYQALIDEWRLFVASSSEPLFDDEHYLERLRQWRRMISLRLAYLSVNDLATEAMIVRELTRLAEFCIRECTTLAVQRWTARYGQPWDEQLARPARFCILGLGKLGGEELNFSSDVDLIFLYEGDGYCRRAEATTSFATVEFFTKVAETVIKSLATLTAAGFLFRVDARLRPEGMSGPLVRSLSSLENYYSVAGQTWERLAWIKARPIAGDLALGAELLESLQDFRYPRHPAPSLLSEIAAVKVRTEKEVVGAGSLDRDVKSGTGGIREIEFIAQANQVLHAGRFPFLQTHQTQIALQQLQRYSLMEPAECDALIAAYWFLRRVEHRLQMREEQQLHALPPPGRVLEELARSLGFTTTAEFENTLSTTRKEVRKFYDALLSEHGNVDEDFEAWWTFLTGARVPGAIEKRLHGWLGSDPDAAAEVRLFARADGSRMITREQVQRFRDLAESLDHFMPELARPALVLRRLARFAERYGSRSHFFSICASQPAFLRVLALLFDRSSAIHELLCAHPEIFEEVIRAENLRVHKDGAALERELAQGPAERAAFIAWFALYLRAEQVRTVISEILGLATRETAQISLTQLADAALRALQQRVPGLEKILVIALGKYGGQELTLGSDLDLLFIAEPDQIASVESTLRDTLRIFQTGETFGPVFAIDTRLRPHGEAGPLVTTMDSLRIYHRKGAQLWERQLLARARVVSGPDSLREKWTTFDDEMVYRPCLSAKEVQAIWRMRLRIQNERDLTVPPERAFKTSVGGLMDHEFLAQIIQLKHGFQHPELRSGHTSRVITAASQLGFIPADAAVRLLENYNFIKNAEWALRRDLNEPVTVLPIDLKPLADWLRFSSSSDLWVAHCARLRKTREMIEEILFPASESK